jgi:hypothetical protein
MTEANEQLIPDGARETIRAHYAATIRDNPGVYRALQARGELRQLGEIAERYATQMLLEVEALAKKYDVASEVGRVGDWWAAWKFCVPHAMRSEEGKAWLPSRGLVLDAPPTPPPAIEAGTSLAEPARKSSFGFQPAIAPPMPPAPAVFAGLSPAEVEGLISAAVEAAIKRPAESTSEIEQVDGAGKMTRQTIRVKHHSSS